MGEILHPNVKGLCSAIAVALVWFSAFVVTKIYQTLETAVGTHWSFWIFASVSIIGTGIVYFILPETKGKTLDEIQSLFRSSVISENSSTRDGVSAEIVDSGRDNASFDKESNLKY